jgi:carboxyl-terminal processing protease
MRIGMFDLNLAKEVKKGLKSLKEAGMEALILDLRNNPGGALPAATAVADLFLPQGLLITETKSNYQPNLFGLKLPGAGGDQVFKTKKKSEFEKMPLVVLINKASASASELLSGALQDHGRALLVGEKTYGKGVGQSPVMLSSVMMKRFLYLTVMEYTLPTGRSIHHKGVEPDVAYSTKKPTAREFALRWKIRNSDVLEKWLKRQWNRNGEKLRELAEYDGFDSGNYPAFDAFYASLDTSLSRDVVRAELRRAIRARVSHEEKRSWVADLETDVQLQRGLVGLLEEMDR